jgi:hypothetical protein
MTKETFLKEVRKEINAIKVNATQEELDRLDFNKFDYNYADLCLYGILTGSSRNERSSELCNKIFIQPCSGSFNRFLNIKNNIELNSKWSLTYLEVYFYHSDSNYHKHIIDYLQSRVKRLKTLKLNN